MEDLVAMYVALAAIVLVFVLVIIACRFAIKPYKEMIKMQNDRIEELQKQLCKAENKSKSKAEPKKEKEDEE